MNADLHAVPRDRESRLPLKSVVLLSLLISPGCGGELNEDELQNQGCPTCFDSGSVSAGGADSGVSQQPSPSQPLLQPPVGKWTWFALDGTRCLDGSSTGFGLNVQDPSQPLMVYLDAGGACVDALTCSIPGIVQHFSAGDFEARRQDLEQTGLFSRDDSSNPLAEMNWAFIPYCTGDVHSGTRSTNGGTLSFVGHTNVQRVLQRLAPTFARAESILLTGASAGGFGTFFNFENVLNAFPGRAVNLLNDSGPLMGIDWMSREFQQLTFSTWGSVTPESCEAGVGSVFAMYACLASLEPTSRFGLLTSTRDRVNRQFLRKDLISPAMSEQDYAAGIADLGSHLKERSQWAVYMEESTRHVFGRNPLAETALPQPNGTSVSAFVAGVVTGKGFASTFDPEIP